MKTILVPTDFSKLSKVAVSYAIGLAKVIDAKVIVLSVLHSGATPQALKSWKKFEEEMIDTAQGDAEQLMGEFKTEKGKVDIWYQSVLGFPVVDKIDEFAVKNKVDLIVMGSKGATGLKKIMMGSNAAALIDKSSVPVIVVPGNTKFRPIKKLVYATDVQNFPKELKVVGGFAQWLNASVEVLHIMPVPTGKNEKKGEDASISREKLIEMARYPKIHLHVVRDNNVAEGVDDFVAREKADLLAMFTHRLDFKEKLLGKSVTRELALSNNVPLLAFNRTTWKAPGQKGVKVKALLTA
jgi:nucleotide-binding universal stress UspA family protein